MHKQIRVLLWSLLFSMSVPGTLPVPQVHLQLIPDSSLVTIDSIPSDSLVVTDAPLEKEPVLLSFVQAVYPPALAKQGIAGTVTMDLLVNERGIVDSVHLLSGVHPELDAAVIDAVYRFLFSPALAQGVPVPVIITYQYRVSLDEVIRKVNEYVNLSGIVLERGTRVPVSGIEVGISFPDTAKDTSLLVPFWMHLERIGQFTGQELLDDIIITQTDAAGRFSCKSLPCGPIEITIVAAGYELFRVEDTIVPDQITEITCRLQKTNYSDMEITVYGKTETKEVSRRTLTLSEIRKIPGFNGDAVKVVQALPGVARSSFGGGSIRVRGAPTWDSKFFLDGLPIPLLYHFGGVKSTYNSDALESVDLYPGGFSSKYGNSVAGVIELKGRDASRERARGFADMSVFDATLFAEGAIGDRGGIVATVRRSYIGDILGFVINKTDFIDLPITVAPYYYDYVVRADIDIASEQKLFFTLFGSKDELELIAPFMRGGSKEVDALADRVQQMNSFNMVMSGWNARIKERWTNQLRAALIQGKGNGSLFGYARWDYDAWEYLLRDELSYSFSEKLQVTTGFDLWWQRYWQKSVFPNTDNTLLKDTMQENFGLIGPFAQVEYRPVPELLIIPGVRFDYYQELEYKGGIFPEFWDYDKFDNKKGISGEPSLRLSTRYELTEGHTVKAALGTYNQTPQPMGLVTHDTLGNPFLPATKARHIVAGYEWNITDLISADVQLYHNQQWDIPLFASTDDLLANPQGPRFLSDGKGRMYGLELLLRHNQSERLFGWIAYTLSRSERFNKEDKAWLLFDRDQTHNLQLILSYRLPREWQVGTRLRYVSGNPYSPVVDRIFDVTGRFYRPVFGQTNSARNDPFFQVDLRFDKRFVFNTWMMSAYIDLQNVMWFAYKSPEFTIYNYDYTDEISVSSPFIPSLGLRVDF